MITTVATWQCRCGVRVKVVAETERTQPAGTVKASCPGCGDQQIIHAHRIISVSEEKSDIGKRTGQ